MQLLYFLFFLTFSTYCVQVQSLPYESDLLSGSWNETQKKLNDLRAKVAEKMSWAEVEYDKAISEFVEEIEKRLVTYIPQFIQEAVKYISDYEDWISKAKNAGIDPSNCTENKTEIELELPVAAIVNVTNLIQVRCYDTAFKAVSVIQNLTFIPLNLRDLQTLLNECDKTDVKCIEDVDDALESYKTYPEQIPEIIVQLKELLGKLLEIADTCILDSIGDFEKEEDELTGEGIQCIKDLINH